MKLLTTRSGSRLALAGLLAAVALAGPGAARAQQRPFEPTLAPPVQNPPGGGTELFRALLDRAEIEPVRASELGRLQPGPDLIVVVLGNPHQWQWEDPTRLARRAVAAGGAALLACDSELALHAFDEPRLNNPIGAFDGETVRADPQKATETHAGRADCPYAVPVSPAELVPALAQPGRVWDVFRGLNRVATNQPTYITMPRYRAEYRYPLARLPQSSYGRDGARFNRPPLLAVGGDGPANRGPEYSFLAVADSGVFINQMLMEEGIDNLKFALNTVEYLRGPNKERKRCVFFENGRVVERFDGLRDALAKPKPKIPPEAMPDVREMIRRHQDKLVAAADAKADEVQTRDALHRSLVGPPGSPRERTSAAAWVERALVAASVSGVLFLLLRMRRARHPQDVPPPPNAGAGAAATGPPGVFGRRQKELVRRNNVYEPVKVLACEFFAGAGAPANPGPRLPPLEVSDEVRKPESLRQALRDLWRLAYGPPAPLTAQRWFELEPYFERLKQAHADGKWRFIPDGA